MSQCHILPPHREHSFRGAEGCTKDISHDGPHTAVLKDGTTIEWETDWECECCVDDEIPDMCIVWRKVDLKGKDMAEFAIIKSSELGDRMDAGFHILRKKHEKEAADIEAKMDRSDAISLAVETLEKVPLKYRRDINPLVRSGQNRAPDLQAQERAVREYPYLALAIFKASAPAITAHYEEEAKQMEETAELFRKIQGGTDQ